jgi:hypothetical protein
MEKCGTAFRSLDHCFVVVNALITWGIREVKSCIGLEATIRDGKVGLGARSMESKILLTAALLGTLLLAAGKHSSFPADGPASRA